MNETYLKYGLITAGVIVVIYALMRGGSQPTQSQSSGGAVAVDVQYSPTTDPSASIAARSQAFGELVGVANQLVGAQAALAESEMANQTAREIARQETALGRYGLNVGRQVEELRIRGAQDLAQFQANQVNILAESFRKTDIDRQAQVLNALTSLWGAQPTFRPERRNAAADIISGIGNAVGKFFSFGLR